MMRWNKKGWQKTSGYIITAITILSSCYRYIPPPPPTPPTTPYVSPDTRYPLGPEDIIEIKLVPDDIGLSGKYEVDEEGRIIMPLLGEMYVTGMTAIGLRKELERMLSKYIKEPYVSVFVRQMKSQKIFVWTPERIGVIFVQRPINALETAIIAGVNPQTDKISKVYIVRWNREKEKSDVYSVDVEKIVREGDFTQNVYLQPGDIVFIPPKNIRNVQQFLGFFSGIGFSIIYATGGLSVLGIAR